MDRIDVDGLPIAFRRTGNGPPLLLLHGAFCDSRDWRRQLDAFAAEFTVIAWDAPGCGESADLPSSDYGLDNLIDTLAGFIRALRLQRPHVLGLSLGSILAIALQAGHPGVVRSLVLASAYAGWAGSLPPAEVQRRIRLTLRDLNRPADQVAREFVATLLPADAPQRGRRRTDRNDHPGPARDHSSDAHPCRAGRSASRRTGWRSPRARWRRPPGGARRWRR